MRNKKITHTRENPEGYDVTAGDEVARSGGTAMTRSLLSAEHCNTKQVGNVIALE